MNCLHPDVRAVVAEPAALHRRVSATPGVLLCSTGDPGGAPADSAACDATAVMADKEDDAGAWQAIRADGCVSVADRLPAGCRATHAVDTWACGAIVGP